DGGDEAAGTATRRRLTDDGDVNTPLGLAVLYGVLDEVLEHLDNLVAVATDNGRLLEPTELDRGPGLAGDRLQRLDHMGHGLVEVDTLGGRQVLAHLDAGERQEIVDQAGHAVGLFAHHLEKALARMRVILGRTQQRLDKTPERGERGSQLVAG